MPKAMKRQSVNAALTDFLLSVGGFNSERPMTDKITVLLSVDDKGYHRYTAGDVVAYSTGDLAKRLGVSEDRFVLNEDEKLIRHRQLSDRSKRLNSPEAIRRRTEWDPSDLEDDE
jgi:hypothetical protein